MAKDTAVDKNRVSVLYAKVIKNLGEALPFMLEANKALDLLVDIKLQIAFDIDKSIIDEESRYLSRARDHIRYAKGRLEKQYREILSFKD